jgi:phage tail-like protein
MRPAETRVTAFEAGAPQSASTRDYLRRGLPVVYREDPRGAGGDPFAMRFLDALEQVLDPVVAMVDMMPAHFDLDLAPDAVVALVGAWFGLELDGSLSHAAERRLVRRANAITRARGTRSGLEELLGLAFEDLDLKVTDSGGVSWHADPHASSAAPEPAITVTCPAGLDAARRRAIRRVVTSVKPAQVAFTLLPEDEEEEAP